MGRIYRLQDTHNDVDDKLTLISNLAGAAPNFIFSTYIYEFTQWLYKCNRKNPNNCEMIDLKRLLMIGNEMRTNIRKC